MKRRHLSEAPRSIVGARLAKLPHGVRADTAIAVSIPTQEQAAETLGVSMDSIRARAIRRCGELLKQFDGLPANAQKQTDATDTLISRTQAATDAGLSEHQTKQAVRVANVPN